MLRLFDRCERDSFNHGSTASRLKWDQEHRSGKMMKAIIAGPKQKYIKLLRRKARAEGSLKDEVAVM